jgi:hypothetical protein
VKAKYHWPINTAVSTEIGMSNRIAQMKIQAQLFDPFAQATAPLISETISASTAITTRPNAEIARIRTRISDASAKPGLGMATTSKAPITPQIIVALNVCQDSFRRLSGVISALF